MSGNIGTRILSITFGIIIVSGVFAFLLGIFVVIDYIHSIFIQHTRDTLKIVMGAILVLFGGGIACVGAKFLNRDKSFAENLWLVGAAMIGIPLFALCFDLVVKVLTTFNVSYDLTMSFLGVFIFMISWKRRGQRKKDKKSKAGKARKKKN